MSADMQQIIIYSFSKPLSGVSNTFVVSGIRVLGDFKQLNRTLQRAIVLSLSIRSRLAAAELPIDYKRDVICIAEAIKRSRNLCKNPAGIFTMVWKIPVSPLDSLTPNYSYIFQGIIYTVDTIPEKTLSDAMEEVLDSGDEDSDVPDLLDDEVLVVQLQNTVIG